MEGPSVKTLAAVLVETGKPLVLAELEIPSLKPGQVLVEIAFSGICHTQILECRGHRGKDAYLPHCLGHEGSGTVRDIGSEVKKVKKGDAVILSWMKGSGQDVPGTVYTWNHQRVNAGAITTFSRYSIISENRLTPLPADVSSQEAALLGCTAATGLGSIFNTAGAKSGQSVAVFGVGGVGLFAVAAAARQGCSPLFAIDLNPSRLELAAQMGATHCVQVPGHDPIKEIKVVCPKGVDIAVEAIGEPAVMQQALQSVRSQGGAVVIIGNAKQGATVTFDPAEFNQGKRLLGTWGGDNLPDRDFPRYLSLLKTGGLKLNLPTKVYGLNQINGALDDLEKGHVVRPLIDMALK